MRQIDFAFSVQGADHIKKENSAKNDGKNLMYPCQDRSFSGIFETLEMDMEKEILLNLRNGESESFILPSQKKLSVSLKKHSVPFKIICVSDGHGSPQYFRSGRGAELAISSLIELVSANVEKFNECYKTNDFSTIEKGLSVGISNNRWIEKIAADFVINPVTEAEYSRLKEEDEDCEKKYRDEEKSLRSSKNLSDIESLKKFFLKSSLKEIYGCTLIAYIEFESFWYALQIGDGDLAISYDGSIYSKPIPEDENCIGNITTSLCGENSYQDFRFAHGENIPNIVLCSSDGMANSVRGEEGLFTLYKWYIERFYNAEFEKCKKCAESNPNEELKCNLDCRIKEAKKIIEKNLSESSKCGSGDDFSLAAIIRLNFDEYKKNCIKKNTYYRYWENIGNKGIEENCFEYLIKSADFENENANLYLGNLHLCEYEKKLQKHIHDAETQKIKIKAESYLQKAGKKGKDSLKKICFLYSDFIFNLDNKTFFDKNTFIKIIEDLKYFGETERIKRFYSKLKKQIIDISKLERLSSEQKDEFILCLNFFKNSEECKELFFALVKYLIRTEDDFLGIYEVFKNQIPKGIID